MKGNYKSIQQRLQRLEKASTQSEIAQEDWKTRCQQWLESERQRYREMPLDELREIVHELDNQIPDPQFKDWSDEDLAKFIFG